MIIKKQHLQAAGFQVIVNALWLENEASLGGALAGQGAWAISRTTFQDNVAPTGSAVYVTAGEASGRWVNVLLDGQADTAVVLAADNAPTYQLDFWHTTFAHPTLDTEATALHLESGQVQLRNSIIANYAQPSFITATGQLDSDYNLFHTSILTPALPSGADDLIADPLFTDAASRNYQPLGSSPAVDSGVDLGILVDIVGQPRPDDIGEAVDRGAYEQQEGRMNSRRWCITLLPMWTRPCWRGMAPTVTRV